MGCSDIFHLMEYMFISRNENFLLLLEKPIQLFHQRQIFKDGFGDAGTATLIKSINNIMILILIMVTMVKVCDLMIKSVV